MIYVTTNGGENFTPYDIPVDPTSLKLHPTMPNWILGVGNMVSIVATSESGRL